MPKTNHDRNFRDERDYTVPGGDFTCGKHGAAHKRFGKKVGLNRRNRSTENRRLKIAGEDFVPVKEHKTVQKAHDYNGKAIYTYHYQYS